jgi:uncharacterized Zn finger protein
MAAVADLADERSLMQIAGAPTYLKGATCAEHRCVELVERGEQNVAANVRDTETYETTLSVVEDTLTWTCTCGMATPEQPCPHVVAVGVTVWRESPPREDQPDDVSKGRGSGLPADEGPLD